jgi:hypothetical protein
MMIAIVSNACTASMSNTVILMYLSNASSFSYQQYVYSYTAISTTTILSFAFRQDPSFWAMDDVYVIDTVTSQTINSDPSFESGTSNCCSTCNPSGSSSAGVVTTGCANTGSYCYYDGSVGNPDYLIITLTTVSGRLYSISFWLENIGNPINSATVLIGS